MFKPKAIVAAGKTKKAQIRPVRVPKLRPDYLLVQVHSIALNPTDWKHAYRICSGGERLGCDYSGTVLQVGEEVTANFKRGDRIAGWAHGGNEMHPEDGAFGNVITVKGDVQLQIPDHLTYEEASTLPVGLTTVGQALCQSLELPIMQPVARRPDFILIYGGSTATGALAIQIARVVGMRVITTCSPHNFDYVLTLGAEQVFNYRDRNCARLILEYTKNELKYVLDCISEGNSITTSIKSMSPEGGIYSNLLSVDPESVHAINRRVECRSTLGYTQFGETFQYGPTKIPAKLEDFHFMKDWYGFIWPFVAQGKIKAHSFEVNKFGGGLAGALEGMEFMKDGKLSGRKLVYNI